MSEKERIQELLRKYHAYTATVAETKEMFGLMAEYEQLFSEEMSAFFMTLRDETPGIYEPQQWQHLLRKVESQTATTGTVKKMNYARWIAAASVILAISLSTNFLLKNNYRVEMPTSVVNLDAINPGTDKATLVLSSGRQVDLQGQNVITDGELTIRNVNSGLVYANSGTVAMNTMKTPRGGQYKLQLADGTKVWLNAASSITYPTVFSQKQRVVAVDGEAYFEVAKDKTKPFIVQVRGQSIEVLGTIFNINAYANESATQTTLLEGVVRIGGKILKPGEALIGEKVKSVNTSQVMAWKNGLFKFDNANMQTIMRQIERWYDIDVRFEGKIPEEIFKGDIERNLRLADIMELLSFMDINYRLENNRVLVISGK